MPNPTLIGRDPELRALTDLLAGAPRQGGALLLRGEAGIGKSALLQAAARHAARSGVQVLTTAGVPGEARLPLAGLHRLLRTVLGLADRLPERQRDALHAAFGARDGAPDTFLVALATLNLLSYVATDSPVAVVADDVQWLDEPTAEVVAFLARRIEAEAIVLLLARRDPDDGALAQTELPDLVLGRLGADDAAALLDAQRHRLPQTVRRRLLAEAEGNPLALVELPRAQRRRVDRGDRRRDVAARRRRGHRRRPRARGLGGADRRRPPADAVPPSPDGLRDPPGRRPLRSCARPRGARAGPGQRRAAQDLASISVPVGSGRGDRAGLEAASGEAYRRGADCPPTAAGA